MKRTLRASALAVLACVLVLGAACRKQAAFEGRAGGREARPGRGRLYQADGGRRRGDGAGHGLQQGRPAGLGRRVHPALPLPSGPSGQDRHVLVVLDDLVPRVGAEADGQGRGQAFRDVHRLLGVRGEGPPLHPREGRVLPRPGLRTELGHRPRPAVRPRPRGGLPRPDGRAHRARPRRPLPRVRGISGRAQGARRLGRGQGPGRRPGHPRPAASGGRRRRSRSTAGP